MPRKNILVVDDEKSQREILEMILAEEGYDVTTAASGEAALKFAKDRRFDLALTDLKMTGMDGIELLQHLLAYDSSIIVILLTAHGSIESAKGSVAARRVRLSRKAVRQSCAAGNDQSRARSSRRDRHRDHLRVAEDGDGEEDDPESRAVKLDGVDSWRVGHRQGVDRASGSQSIAASTEMFQAVNCAAINENLLESELFGHEKGSFTGAHAEKKGLFEIADRGTLFLDEIAELDVGIQAKLLRALQERKIGASVVRMRSALTCA